MNSRKSHSIIFLLAAGFFARLFAFSFFDIPFANDVRTFQLWASELAGYGFGDFTDIHFFLNWVRHLARNGFREFYAADFFSDYPPGYMYVLFIIGLFQGTRFFDIATFLPAILADVAIAFVIYKIALKAAPENISFALLAVAAWLFNPAIILISSVWGQVESVFVLVLLVSLVLLRGKKLLPAYALFGLAILIKPQSLFLGPVYLFSVYDYFTDGVSGRKFLYFIGSLFAGAGVMVLISLPFGLVATIEQLWYGMDSYNFASVNAFNYWALVGGNWAPLDARFLGITFGTWGVIVALHIIAAALVALYIDKRRTDGKNFYLIVAALFILIFTFSVKMHERYLFPGLLFLLVYYLENRDRRELILYWAFSAVFFINCLEVLRWAGAGFDWDMLAASSIRVVPYVTVFLAVLVIYLVGRNLQGNFAPEKPPPDTPKNPPSMRRRDYIFLGILIAVYSTLALTNLGDRHAPQTAWVVTPENNLAYFDFGEEVYISEFQFLMGARHNIAFGVHFSDDNENWEHALHFEGGDVFAWHSAPLDVYATYAAIGGNDGLRLQEIAFRGRDGEILQIAGVSDGAENLIDEQHLVPVRRYFMNSAYFDEI
ncbi:MAG: glycosyltransferase 87 family protein [Defluviitaleaceae bacterium]|nr:glycosyltransferase 87 family protein [Defluviitaleaceae bacterium]